MKTNQKGSIIVLLAVCITVIMMSLAMTVDIGWMVLAEGQLQNAADAAALAGASQLPDEDVLYGTPDQTDDIGDARDSAQAFAAYNKAANVYLQVDRNEDNYIDGGIVAGYIQNPLNINSSFQTDEIPEYNSIQVTAKLANDLNGPLALLMGSFSGMQSVELQATSTATIDDRIAGFEVDVNERLMMLPFTVYADAWDEAVDGGHHPADCSCPHEPDEDDYSYSEESGVLHQSDGIPEISMYPNNQDVCTLPWAPGNFGTIDIGPSNNSTSDLIDQIENGISGADLEAIGGMILTDEDEDGVYSKWLNGDTGVSAAIKCAFEAIIGQPRILPLHRNLTGTGDGAMYEIVRFAGVRVVDVKMTGALDNRCVIVQTCPIVSSNAVFSANGPKSGMIFAVSITR
ncbi:MAG: pilus assembly protein TadG-related protein [Candidatus Omnitrophota bacterium]